LQTIEVYVQSVPRIHGHNFLDATPLTDSGIPDQLTKWHSLTDYYRCDLNSSVSSFVVCYFHHKKHQNYSITLFYVKLMTQKWAI